jgi:predicted small metal-binding protein
MKEVRCADAGLAWDFVAQAKTEEDLMRRVAADAREKHGVIQATPELVKKVRKIMRDVK